MTITSSVPGQTVDAFKANVDMSDAQTYQFTAIGLGSAENIDGETADDGALAKVSAQAPYFGVLQNAPAQGAQGTVMINGLSKVRISSDVSVGQPLIYNADGTFSAAVSDGPSVGIAAESGQAGGLSTAYLVPSATGSTTSSGPGFRLLSGTSDPNGSTGGNIGDLYLNTSSGTLFGPLEDDDSSASNNVENGVHS